MPFACTVLHTQPAEARAAWLPTSGSQYATAMAVPWLLLTSQRVTQKRVCQRGSDSVIQTGGHADRT